jgi:hypothetical protein
MNQLKNYICISPFEKINDNYNLKLVVNLTKDSTDNIVRLSEEEIEQLNSLWDLINDINDSMIGIYEDGWISDNNLKIEIINKIELDLEYNFLNDKKIIELM